MFLIQEDEQKQEKTQPWPLQVMNLTSREMDGFAPWIMSAVNRNWEGSCTQGKGLKRKTLVSLNRWQSLWPQRRQTPMAWVSPTEQRVCTKCTLAWGGSENPAFLSLPDLSEPDSSFSVSQSWIPGRIWETQRMWGNSLHNFSWHWVKGQPFTFFRK